MADLFVEVDEALKQERLEKLWQQYGGFLIGFLAVVILGTAANSGYTAWVTKQNTAQTDIFLETINDPQHNAENLLNITGDLQPKLKSVAEIRAATLALQAGNTEHALQIYQDLAKAKKADTTIKAIAEYMTVTLFDGTDTAEKIKKLTSISVNEENPLRYQAMLDIAVIEANVSQDYKKAKAQLTKILETEKVPQTLKQKAQSLNILYGLKDAVQNTKDKT